MEKEFADKMIAQFQKKFFGFALSKCTDTTEAEELAARITCEAYVTLRTVENVYNWEGYLYKIASNVYARYVQEQTRHKTDAISELEVSDGESFEGDYIKKEELELLKREVAWLGKRHREIILLHYYHNKKVAEIAEILDIPEGTVKWHLSDAKKLLKEGLRQPRDTGNLGLEPIKLCSLGHAGTIAPGAGKVEEHLNSKLRQNIVFAAYFIPKTVEEIATELNVSPVFIEDEVAYLEEWGFLDLLAGKRYRTNMFIECIPYEAELCRRELDAEVAKMVCDIYIPELIERARDYDRECIYVPDDDFNYFLWTFIPMTLTQYSMRTFCWTALKRANCWTKRKDGSEYAATATLYDEKVHELRQSERESGPSCLGETEVPVFVWELSTKFQDREFDATLNGYVSFARYLKGGLPKTEAVLDMFVRFYERGLLRQEDDIVNVLVVKEKEKEGFFAQIDKYAERNPGAINMSGSLHRYMPQMPQELLEKIEETCEKRIALEKPYFPKHMHKALAFFRQADKINVTMVMEELIRRGVLEPLTDAQKKGVMTVIYSDVLPERKTT